ncbi:MAG: hypothetical protein Q7T20_11695 [Saprospiraceae bacterium]|nr:hypothetical protein [Saprospiraceae bacterium]
MSNISKSVLAGIIGTAVMTMVMFIAPMMGMPKMSPPEMLAAMMSVPVSLGWAMHFMIGIIFALGYVYLFAPRVKTQNLFVKGAIFGFAAFIFAQIIMAVMGMFLPIPEMEGSMLAMIIGSILGHVVYGITVAKIINQ